MTHFKSVKNFWNRYEVSKRPTSGFYFVSCAIALCEEVHLFGFWPFRWSISARKVSQHYYDRYKVSDIHDAPYELKLLVSMHHHGLLKLHVHDCSTSYFGRESKLKPVASTLIGGLLNLLV